jgi:hypothetical protein
MSWFLVTLTPRSDMMSIVLLFAGFVLSCSISLSSCPSYHYRFFLFVFTFVPPRSITNMNLPAGAYAAVTSIRWE